MRRSSISLIPILEAEHFEARCGDDHAVYLTSESFKLQDS